MERKFLPERIDEAIDPKLKVSNTLLYSVLASLAKTGKYELDAATYRRKLDINAPRELSDLAMVQNIQKFATDTKMHSLIFNFVLFKSEGYKRYVFASDFFDVLQQVSVENVTYAMLPKELSAVIRFPSPISDTGDDHITEACISITSAATRRRLGSVGVKSSDRDDKLFLSVSWITVSGRNGHWLDFFPDDLTRKVMDEEVRKQSSSPANTSIFRNGVPSDDVDLPGKSYKKGDEKLVDPIIRCLIYLCSGQPDLREFRNEIKYQSPTSRTPIKAHKELTEEVIYRVGFNWMKDPIYKTDAWSVKPYLRYQPCGPGLTQYRLIMVREHMRHRKERQSLTPGSETVSGVSH